MTSASDPTTALVRDTRTCSAFAGLALSVAGCSDPLNGFDDNSTAQSIVTVEPYSPTSDLNDGQPAYEPEDLTGQYGSFSIADNDGYTYQVTVNSWVDTYVDTTLGVPGNVVVSADVQGEIEVTNTTRGKQAPAITDHSSIWIAPLYANDPCSVGAVSAIYFGNMQNVGTSTILGDFKFCDPVTVNETQYWRLVRTNNFAEGLFWWVSSRFDYGYGPDNTPLDPGASRGSTFDGGRSTSELERLPVLFEVPETSSTALLDELGAPAMWIMVAKASGFQCADTSFVRKGEEQCVLGMW